ncbi:MAG: hypothetical protein GY715_02295 [Planctomycetes bacterium]|nr:hypothetical protein [Planctomycetota bacterium]
MGGNDQSTRNPRGYRTWHAGGGIAVMLTVCLAVATAVAANPGPVAARPAARAPARPAADISPGLDRPKGRCQQCHQVEPDFSHPVGFVPSRPLPPEFPTPDGRLECVTCHETPAEWVGQEMTQHGRLRGPRRAPALCHRCHDARSARDGHAATHLAKAHLLWPDDRARDDGADAFGGFDAESTVCLGCHDGTVAGAGFGPAGGAYHGRGSHPIDVAYGRQGRRPEYDGLRHPTLLDPRVRLFDDRIGCGSCHSPYSDRDSLLVMTNDRSTLCLSCHDY